MRSDIVPGSTFPDYELPDHTRKLRKLSELQGDDPLILTLARGHYRPKEHQQHRELAFALSEHCSRIHADRHNLHRRPPHTAGVPFIDRCPVDVSVRSGTDGSERPGYPGAHRPRAQSYDSAHAGSHAWSRDLPHLQRLLVLGPSFHLGSLAGPAHNDERNPR